MLETQRILIALGNGALPLQEAALMTAFVRYRIYGGVPPNLSARERMALGEAIVRVGRKQFVVSLKRRLSPPLYMTGAEHFTFQDVLSDVQKGLPVRAKPSAIYSLQQRLDPSSKSTDALQELLMRMRAAGKVKFDIKTGKWCKA